MGTQFEVRVRDSGSVSKETTLTYQLNGGGCVQGTTYGGDGCMIYQSTYSDLWHMQLKLGNYFHYFDCDPLQTPMPMGWEQAAVNEPFYVRPSYQQYVTKADGTKVPSGEGTHTRPGDGALKGIDHFPENGKWLPSSFCYKKHGCSNLEVTIRKIPNPDLITELSR